MYAIYIRLVPSTVNASLAASPSVGADPPFNIVLLFTGTSVDDRAVVGDMAYSVLPAVLKLHLSV